MAAGRGRYASVGGMQCPTSSSHTGHEATANDRPRRCPSLGIHDLALESGGDRHAPRSRPRYAVSPGSGSPCGAGACRGAAATRPLDTGRSAPIRGEGDDLGSLFADLIEDLLGQIEFFGDGLHDVALDGVLRREDGGYVGWGYASGTLEAASPGRVPRLLGSPTASEGAAQASSCMRRCGAPELLLLRASPKSCCS